MRSLAWVAGGMAVIFATQGYIFLALAVGIAVVTGCALLWGLGTAVAEQAAGSNPSKTAVAVGIAVVILALLFIGKSCHVSAPEDFDPGDYGRQMGR